MICAICGLRGVYGYVLIKGTGKHVCIPCCEVIAEAKKRYIADVIHKAQKHPSEVHLHPKIADPDQPSDKEIGE